MMSVLEIINEELNSLSVPYEFMRWTGAVQYPYWVGEYSETPTFTEDGHKQSTVLLTGTTKGSWLELEQTRAEIEKHFPAVCGLRKATADGAVAIYYANSFPVPTGEADLKRMQINLQVEEWKGMN